MKNIIRFQDSTFVKQYLSILLLAVSAAFCILPFIFHQTLFVSHDIIFHLFQSDQFYKSIASGTLMPKWALDANNGYGSANFIFYSPLSYYVISLFHSFIPSLILSIIAAIWSSFFLSGISMFLMVKKYTSRSIGLLCAVLYQIFPFHIIDLYLRGTLGELFAFIWLPLIFTFLYEILFSEKKHPAFIGLSLSYAGLILTHLVSAFIVSGIAFVYILLNVFYAPSKKEIISAYASVTLGFGLASYFILPVFFELSFVQINYIRRYSFADYKNNFLLQLNTLNAEIFNMHSPNNFLGILNITVVLEVLLFLIVIFFLYKKNQFVFKNRYRFFSVYIFLLAFFMSTPLSRWLWNLLPPLNTIQFPWRWLAYMELALIFLIGSFLHEVKVNRYFPQVGKYRYFLYVLSALILISVITIFVRNDKFPEQAINNILYPDKSGYDTYLPREYTPVWGTNLERILTLPIPDRVTVVSGTAIAHPVTWKPEERLIKVEADSPAVLRVATFYYPGWIAESDGKRKQVFIEKKSGTMLIDIQPGNHMLTLKLVDTPLRRTAKYLSLLSCLILFLYIAKNRTEHG